MQISRLDVDERHLLRLGHGEAELDVESDFSKFGRINFMLKSRIQLLAQVEKLAEALNLPKVCRLPDLDPNLLSKGCGLHV